MPSYKIFSDISIFTNENLYIGFLSQIGLFLWSSGATMSFFSAKLLEDKNQKMSHCLNSFGLYTILLLIDDAFCFHEIVLPLKGIREEITLSFFFLVFIFLLKNNLNLIDKSSKRILIFTSVLLFSSQLIDLLHNDIFYLNHIDIEELLKFGGIISWTAFIYSLSSYFINLINHKLKEN